MLNKTGGDAGLPEASLDRHRDVIATEIARAEAFLKLLGPAAKALEALTDNSGTSLGVRRLGWTLDQLFPYLLRDWTNTAELAAAGSTIRAAIKSAIRDPSDKSLVVAGCGAGGLLTELPPGFKRILGFDLTLPVLAAARHLLDGKSLQLALPRAIYKPGSISLSKRDLQSSGGHIELAAMDAFDSAFADGSIDCVITTFMIDLLPDPRKLADEIRRILSADGVWINYGPSGPLNALWRFDQAEGKAFFEAAGFTVEQTDAYRATYLDLSRDCPSWSFQNHMCYLTSARKGRDNIEKSSAARPNLVELSKIIPQHFPGATLIQRQSLGTNQPHTILLRHERVPGRMENLAIDRDAVRIMALVDGKRTVQEIADLLKQTMPTQSEEETLRAFARYFKHGLLSSSDERS
jgi:SAM-dependent methyltransferase